MWLLNHSKQHNINFANPIIYGKDNAHQPESVRQRDGEENCPFFAKIFRMYNKFVVPYEGCSFL